MASPNLRAYVVWLPVLNAGNVESAAHREAGRIRDSRALHFFDPDARLAKQFSDILHLPNGIPAWDVYLVFGPDALWRDAPPAPAYWMHQLGRGPSGPYLNGDRLAGVVSGLLASKSGKAAQLPAVVGPGLSISRGGQAAPAEASSRINHTIPRSSQPM